MKYFIALFSFFYWSISYAQITLPRLVSNGAVLQRDDTLSLWGKANPNDKLTLLLDNKTYKFKSDAKGDWKFNLPPHGAGGPYELIIKSKSQELKINNLLFGDVWLCTGQSNMVLNMERVKEKYGDEIETANYPQIRNFFIKTMTDLNGAQKDLPDGKWVSADPRSVLEFGAVSYFFAKEIFEKTNVPIGIINSSVGGTPIEAWISESGYKDFEDIQRIITRNKNKQYIDSIRGRLSRDSSYRPQRDAGLLQTPKWYETDYVEKGWLPINIPGYWEDQGLNNLDGIVWYRRDIDVPASMCGVDAKLFMGRIVDADQVYINGKQIGQVTYQYPPRRYTVSKDLLKPGKNTITVRVQNTNGKGGFVPDKPYYIIANGQEIDLKGTWKYKVGQVNESFAFGSGGGGGIVAQNQPSALYNAMTAPIVSQTKIKGVLWYQGESNTGNPKPYKSYLQTMIRDYRNLFNSPELPFLYVQLANFMEQDLVPVESNWAELRQSQLAALDIKNTAMAVTIDVGEWNDIHPLNKKAVGERLAMAARNLVYGEKDLLYSGPIFKSASIQNNKIILSFNHVGNGLKSSDGEPLKYFAIAGENKKFQWADAKITGNVIEVSSDKIKSPRYVRYAWANNPVFANLTNDSDIPASPFQASIITDDESNLWHGKKAAIVLTYDDALDVHLDNAIPALDALGMKGSFYLTAAVPGSYNRINDWRRVSRNGHELGNHTIYHPCDGTKPGRAWLNPLNDLSKYTTFGIVREIEMTNAYLESIDGKKERTFAYTCGDTQTGEGSFIDAIKNKFVAMRGVRGVLNKQNAIDYNNIDCYVIDNNNVEKLQGWAEKARDENGLMVVLFHGVGGGHNLDTDLDKHNQFLKYLSDHPDDFWVTTMIEAAKHSKEMKK